MRVRVTDEDVPFVGRRGEIKEIPSQEARVLILVGKVEEVIDRDDELRPPATAGSSAPPIAEVPDERQQQKRRRYNRRDMGAEPR